MASIWVVLLRGINVGGHRKVPMAALREAYGAAGCAPVLTYIQSGNVVVGSVEADADALAARLRGAVVDACGVDADLMVRTGDAWRALVRADPFPEADEDHLHLALLDAPAPAGAADSLRDRAVAPEQVHVTGTEAYFCLPRGITDARKLLTVVERTIGPTTMRNWRTVRRISAMVDEAAAATA